MQDDVREAFRRVGEIKVQLIKDRDSGESRGFGFITFSDAFKAEEALGGMGLELRGWAFTKPKLQRKICRVWRRKPGSCRMDLCIL